MKTSYCLLIRILNVFRHNTLNFAKDFLVVFDLSFQKFSLFNQFLNLIVLIAIMGEI